MDGEWAVRAEDVWKRYCRSLRRTALRALGEAAGSFLGLRPSPRPLLGPGEFWSLRDVSFQLEAGRALAFVGRNGAGKSTLLKLLAGIISPDRGALRTRGRVASLLMAGAGFHPLLTGRENIHVYGSLLGLRRREIDRRMDDIVDFAGIGPFLETPVKLYSSGMVLRLAFSVAAHLDPQVLLIDEVLAVGDAEFRERCLQHLLGLKRRGCALVLVSHSAAQLRRLADRGIWLEEGRVMADGPLEEVLERYAGSLGLRAAAPEPPGNAPAERIEASGEGEPAMELLDLRVEGREAAEVALAAGRETLLAFRLRANRPLPGLRIAISLDTPSGRTAAGSWVETSEASHPRGRTGEILRASFRVVPRLAGGGYRLRLRVHPAGCVEEGPALLDREWPCHLAGRDGPSSLLDLEEAVRLRREAEPPGRECRREEIEVDPGDPVPLEGRLDVPQDIGPAAAAWVLLDGEGAELARVPLAVPPPGPGALCVEGGIRAHVPPGSYRSRWEWDPGRGRLPLVVEGARITVRERALPLGHADLDARASFLPETGGPAEDRQGFDLRSLSIEGRGGAMEPLLPPGAQVILAEDAAEDGAARVYLESGEPCRARLRFRAHPSLGRWEVDLWLQHPKGWRSAGMRARCEGSPGPAGRFEARLDFLLHLHPGEYIVGAAIAARSPSGETLAIRRDALARCHVLGREAGLRDTRIEVLEVEESQGEGSAAASEAPPEPAGRILRVEMGEGDPVARPVIPAGKPSPIRLEARFLGPVKEPTFKLSWMGRERAAGTLANPDRRRSFAAARPGEVRRWRVEIVHHLAPGTYPVQAALQERVKGQAIVLDARSELLTVLVPARGRPFGQALLEAWAVIEEEPSS